MTDQLTDSQVNKAGRTIRRYLRSDESDAEKFHAALDMLLTFRATHQTPLITANMGLRSVVRTVGCADVEVSQRLKRVPTIIDKLIREPSLALSRMQDIGGCRAVLASIDEVRRVEARLVHNGRVQRISDYISTPRDSGYRGVHVIVKYRERLIEVQLRTWVMHQWAVTVEALSAALGMDVKSGLGPRPVQDLMAAVSEAMAIEEAGGEVPRATLENLEQRRRDAAEYLGRGRR